MVCTDAAGEAPGSCPALVDLWASGLPPTVTRSRYRDRVTPNIRMGISELLRTLVSGPEPGTVTLTFSKGGDHARADLATASVHRHRRPGSYSGGRPAPGESSRLLEGETDSARRPWPSSSTCREANLPQGCDPGPGHGRAAARPGPRRPRGPRAGWRSWVAGARAASGGRPSRGTSRPAGRGRPDGLLARARRSCCHPPERPRRARRALRRRRPAHPDGEAGRADDRGGCALSSAARPPG